MAVANLAVKWVPTGEDEFGTPQFSLHPPEGHEDEAMHFVITGIHSTGDVTLPDGTVYNVSQPVIRVQSPEHAGLVHHLIAEQHEVQRRLGFAPDEERHPDTGEVVGAPHICTDHCGVLARQTTAADAFRSQQGLRASGTAEAASGNALAAGQPFVNLHSGDTGTSGANELASTRQAVAWTSATSGSPNPSNSSAISIALAASTTASYLGGWSAVTTGTFWLGYPLSPSVTTGTSAGTVTFAAGAVAIGSS